MEAVSEVRFRVVAQRHLETSLFFFPTPFRPAKDYWSAARVFLKAILHGGNANLDSHLLVQSCNLQNDRAVGRLRGRVEVLHVSSLEHRSAAAVCVRTLAYFNVLSRFSIVDVQVVIRRYVVFFFLSATISE